MDSTMNVSKSVSMAAGLVLAAVIVYALFMALCGSPYPYPQGIRLAGRTSVSSDWIELTPGRPLGPTKRPCVRLFVSDSVRATSEGMRFPNGSVAVPEIRFVDRQGTSHDLTYIGDDDGNGGVSFCLNSDGGVYKTVQIRSSIPFECSEITWYGTFRF
jgi:hypothetical protein